MLAVQAGCAPLSISFLPCGDDAVSLPPLLLLSVKSSKTRVRGLPVVTYDDHETDYRGDHRSDEPQLDFFFDSFPLISAGFCKRFCLQFVGRHVPLRDGGSLSTCFSLMLHLILSRCIDKVVSLCPLAVLIGLVRFLSISVPLPWSYAVPLDHFSSRSISPSLRFRRGLFTRLPGPYFEVELVFIFFLPFVNAPGEIHRGEMVFGLMALRDRRPGAVWDTRLCPFVPRVFPCLR